MFKELYAGDEYENGEYIVKAKNKEINLRHFPKKNLAFLVLCGIAILFEVFCQDIKGPIVFFLNINILIVIFFLLLLIILICNFFMWELDVKNGIILVKCLLTPIKYSIKYEQIINIRKKYNVYYEDIGILAENSRAYIEIEYLKKGKIRKIKLDYNDRKELKNEVKELIQLFCTNKMLEKDPSLENDYIDIRDKELDDYIRNLKEKKMQKEQKNVKIAKVLIIMGLIGFCIMTYIIVSSNGYI